MNIYQLNKYAEMTLVARCLYYWGDCKLKFYCTCTMLQSCEWCQFRVVMPSPRFFRSVPLLKSLHWLPMHYRIIFKICTIAYQALSSTRPAYLNAMLTPARNSRQLRSTSSNPLYIPWVKTKAGTRAFSVAAPTVWNSLPASVKSEGNIVSFRRRPKTYLFNAAYPPSFFIYLLMTHALLSIRLRVCLIPWFCHTIELDLWWYWCKRSYYYYCYNFPGSARGTVHGVAWATANVSHSDVSRWSRWHSWQGFWSSDPCWWWVVWCVSSLLPQDAVWSSMLKRC